MVILMARQGGSTGERLLAVCVRALVRPFARVDASMASKRTGVAEGLCGGYALAVFMELLGEGRMTNLAATLAHVWLFASVDALMDSQC